MGFLGPPSGRRLEGYDYEMSSEEEQQLKLEQKRMAEKFRRYARLKAYSLHQKGQILGGAERYAQFLETISNKELLAYDIDREIGTLESEYLFYTRYPHMASKLSASENTNPV